MAQDIKRVLIVDDERHIGNLLAATLSKLGQEYLVDTVLTPHEALERIHTHTYDVVLTDYLMPKMNGLELSQIIRQVSPQSQIILMTAYSSESIRQLADEMRLDGFVDKPTSLNKIREIVRTAVEKTREAANPIDLAIETLNQSEQLLHNLRTNTNARCVLLLRAEGHLISQSGDTQNLAVNTIGTLVAANFMAASELAKLLGDATSVFKSSYHEGPDYHIYAYRVSEEVLLAVVFGIESKAGMVRFYTHQTAEQLVPLLKQTAVTLSLDKDTSRLMDAELDKLFSL